MSRLLDVAAALERMAETLAGTEQGEACAFAVGIMREQEEIQGADTARLDAIERMIRAENANHEHMKPHLVTAYFLKPNGDPFAVKTIEINWNDRASVRDFARRSDEWLSKEVGNRVLTETKQLPAC